MPDEVIKEVLRIIYENADAFGDLLPAGNYICKETMTRVGSPEIMHPAAVDFYREKGLRSLFSTIKQNISIFLTCLMSENILAGR